MGEERRCPACGETQALSGTERDGRIHIVCETCGTSWFRQDRVCAGCGSPGPVALPQVLTTHPRGNQLAIIGRREISLCRSCDVDAVRAAESSGRPVPADYVSVFAVGRRESYRDPAASAPVSPAAPRRRPALRRAARMEPSAPAPVVPDRPTVRQATERFLAGHPDVNPVDVVLLGSHLGSSTRLESLGHVTGDEICAWFESTWGSQSAERRAVARATLQRIFDHWHEQGWLAPDPSGWLAGPASD